MTNLPTKGEMEADCEREDRLKHSPYVCAKHELHDGSEYGDCLWCLCERYKQQIQSERASKREFAAQQLEQIATRCDPITAKWLRERAADLRKEQ